MVIDQRLTNSDLFWVGRGFQQILDYCWPNWSVFNQFLSGLLHPKFWTVFGWFLFFSFFLFFFFIFQFYLKSFNHSNGLRPILTKIIKPNNQWRNWLFGPNSDRILPKIDQIQTNISQIPAKFCPVSTEMVRISSKFGTECQKKKKNWNHFL